MVSAPSLFAKDPPHPETLAQLLHDHYQTRDKFVELLALFEHGEKK